MVAGIRHLTVLGCIAGLLWTAPARAQSESDRDRAKAAVVMIRSKLPAGDAFGAGVVVAASAQDVYVVTANHLVRRGGVSTGVQVQFNARRGEWFDARILDLQDADLDLAAVIVRLPPALTAPMLRGAGAAPSTLARGSDVYPLGYPAQRGWDPPVTPDKVAGSSSFKLTFQSQFVRPGNSGGPLLDACGRIVGIVVLSDPPDAEAIRIEAVLDAVTRWSLPSRILTIDASTACGGTSAPAAVTTTAETAAPGGNTIADVRRLHEQERWAESLPALTRLVSEQPSNAEVYALRSHAYSHLGRTSEAVADGEQAVRLGPRLSEAYLRRGEAKSGTEKQADALADYDRAIQLDPKQFEAWANRGFALLTTGEPQKALDSANQALKIRSDRYEPWVVRANAYVQLKNFVAGINDYTQAIGLRPNEPVLYVYRSGAYYQTQQWELALNDVNQALRLHPDDADALFTRGAIYVKLGRSDSARQDLEFALRLRPGMTEASNMLNTLNRSVPSRPTAAPAEPATAGAGGAVAYARLVDQTAEALRLNRFAEAGTLVDQMIALDPSRGDGWALRGAMLVGANNLPGAFEAYQNAIVRGGTVYFRLAHDHGNGLPPCIGPVAISASGIAFTGENGGHQFRWAPKAISEAALNPFYGVGIGMLHIKTPGARGIDTFNFAVVRANDQQIVNRRPDAELLIALVNSLTQSAGR